MIETAHETYEQIRTKECSKCKEIKSFSEFYKQKGRKFGLASNCKECRKQHYQENEKEIKLYKKEYREKNKEKIKERDKRYYQKTKEKRIEYARQYKLEHKERLRESSKQYYHKNKDRIREYKKLYCKENKEGKKAYDKKYSKENKEKIKEYHILIKNSFPESFGDKRFCFECNEELSIQQIRFSTLFCSKKCSGLASRKPLGEHAKGFRGFNWQFKRKIIRERDNYTCQICGEEENGVEHHVHHIIPYHSFGEKLEANRESNLITLCQSCHRRYEDRADLMLDKIFGKNMSETDFLKELKMRREEK